MLMEVAGAAIEPGGEEDLQLCKAGAAMLMEVAGAAVEPGGEEDLQGRGCHADGGGGGCR